MAIVPLPGPPANEAALVLTSLGSSLLLLDESGSDGFDVSELVVYHPDEDEDASGDEGQAEKKEPDAPELLPSPPKINADAAVAPGAGGPQPRAQEEYSDSYDDEDQAAEVDRGH